MMRRHPPLLAFVVGVVFMAAGPAAIAGCGTPVASPEHLGTWFGHNDTVAVTITVAGSPDHYTAKLMTATPPGWIWGSEPNFHGGEADAGGYVVFDTMWVDPVEATVAFPSLYLTLSPVFGDTMTVTFNTTAMDSQAVEVRRQ